jgi:pseudoazurin
VTDLQLLAVDKTSRITGRTETMKTLILATLVSLTAPAMAAESTIEMLNSKNGENLVFSEKFTNIAKGDTVTFKASKPGHNAEFVPGGFPQGAEELHGQVGKDVAYTFNVSGIYLVRCAPHYGMGMVAVVEVDAPSNIDQIKQLYLPGKVRSVVDEQLKKAQM